METLEQVQARHRKETKDLQGRITNKKKNATKKTRKGVNDECSELERQLKERHEAELRAMSGDASDEEQDGLEAPDQNGVTQGAEDNTADATVNGVANQLSDTKLSGPDSSTTTSTVRATSAQQQQPKKRNRQKDRLARRAAEQEAAAVKAEEEAANMVDHRGIEKTYMLKEFKANALEEKEIQPDGHCLFSAVADQLEQSAIPLGAAPGDQPYRLVRRAAAGYMQAHGDDFAGFLEEPLDSYVAKIRDTAEWGGQLELSALANTYNVEIHVIQDGRTEIISPTAGGDDQPKKIWLAYYRHGYGLGEHYNSLRKKS